MGSRPSPRCIFSRDDGGKDGILRWGIRFSWWLTLISLYTHFLPRTVRWSNIKLRGSCCPLSNIYLRLMLCQIAEFLLTWEISGWALCGFHSFCWVSLFFSFIMYSLPYITLAQLLTIKAKWWSAFSTQQNKRRQRSHSESVLTFIN